MKRRKIRYARDVRPGDWIGVDIGQVNRDTTEPQRVVAVVATDDDSGRIYFRFWPPCNSVPVDPNAEVINGIVQAHRGHYWTEKVE